MDAVGLCVATGGADVRTVSGRMGDSLLLTEPTVFTWPTFASLVNVSDVAPFGSALGDEMNWSFWPARCDDSMLDWIGRLVLAATGMTFERADMSDIES